MLNEPQEFLSYTGVPVYSSASKQDYSYLGRIAFATILNFEGLPRIFSYTLPALPDMASPVLLRTDISIQSDIKRTERVKNPVDKDGTFSTGKDGSLITFPAEYIFKD